MSDLMKTIEPKSDQLNFDDFIGEETKTITISRVKIVNSDQPIELHSAEYPGRPFKPGLTMRRVLIGIWGKSAAGWEGRRLTLYGDPEVTFGKQKVGGIRISNASHIDGPKTLMLTVTRGKKAPFTVRPLQADPVAPDGWQDDVAACGSVEELTEFYEMAAAAGWWSAEVAAACTARKQELSDAEAG